MLGRFDPDLGQLIVDEEAGFEIGALIKWLLRDCRASSVMLLDQAGQIIVCQGDVGGDQRVQLGALIAGVFASTREVARILGERDFHSFLQEGAGESVLAASIGGQWLLAVIFGTSAQLGLVKLLAGRTAIELNGVLERTLERNRRRPKLNELGIQIVANDTIDLLFRNDVAKQWTED